MMGLGVFGVDEYCLRCFVKLTVWPLEGAREAEPGSQQCCLRLTALLTVQLLFDSRSTGRNRSGPQSRALIEARPDCQLWLKQVSTLSSGCRRALMSSNRSGLIHAEWMQRQPCCGSETQDTPPCKTEW
ncbi:hypothetical protein AOLI_G00094360 [Acnodon oligacanthus]